MRIPKRRRAIAPVLGTLIFLLVAIASFVAFGAVISKGLSFNQAAISAQTVLSDKGKEILLVTSSSSVVVPANPPTTPTCPPNSTNSIIVQNTGAITSNITYTFGVDTAGNLWTCKAPLGQTALAPGANETFFLPSQIANGFTATGVITSLGNTFYADVSPNSGVPGAPVVVGGSLFLDPAALLHFDVAPNPLGDGYALNGYGPWPTTGGISLNVGSVESGGEDQNYVIFGLQVKNLDPTRSISLNQYSNVEFGRADWYLADSLAPEGPPYTSGVSYNPFNPGAPPTIGPGQTTTLYFAAPCPESFECDEYYQGVPDTGPGSASAVTVTLFGTYSDGSIYSGSTDLGVGYYTCLNPVTGFGFYGCFHDFFDEDNGVNVTCGAGTSCPVVASAGKLGPFEFYVSGFASPPDVYIVNPGGTVSLITDTKSMERVTFSIPASTSAGYHQIFVTDGVDFVDATVEVI